MRAKLVEIAAGLVLGLALLGASAGATLVMGRLIDVGAGARFAAPREAAR